MSKFESTYGFGLTLIFGLVVLVLSKAIALATLPAFIALTFAMSLIPGRKVSRAKDQVIRGWYAVWFLANR